MTNVTCILVDDEIASLKNLEKKINQFFSNLTILDRFQKPEDAILFLNSNEVDVVFLDIQMPRINGFELLTNIINVTFKVIFVTAYNEYALEALKNSAIDYILKPIDDDDLKIAIQKTIKLIDEENESTHNKELVELLQESISNQKKLLVPNAKGFSVIEQSDILYLEGYEGYTKINIDADRQIISSYGLGKYEQKLNTDFFKTHKSYIVNLNKIIEFENEGYVVLCNNVRIPISKKLKNELLELLK
ncbi:LytR/AlgR family response regulator transcription factor [Flavobacterium ardleyense]|uniref:LytR/AlgR family response regulator transcription factor n=1 Tax=Flavobacterium ardleyense TaxID=2038737 RepID=A0ABW5ZAM4_9FLAO